jgi:putative AdoMet-dependent methyltransferase
MLGEAFPASDFDRWAEVYDQDVLSAEIFPFAGYRQVLDAVAEQAEAKPGMCVLDLGTGTGNLARRFADLGCRMWGSDFSTAMLAKARQKLPEARFVLHDLRGDWPPELQRLFDRIVSGYAFHHFELIRKVGLIQRLRSERLEPGGRLVIADISFASQAAMQDFAASAGDLWEEEPYWVADEALEAAGVRAAYQQVSACAGVYRIEQD